MHDNTTNKETDEIVLMVNFYYSCITSFLVDDKIFYIGFDNSKVEIYSRDQLLKDENT